MICIHTHNNHNIFYFGNHHILVHGTKSYVNLTMGLEGSSLPVKTRNTNIWANRYPTISKGIYNSSWILFLWNPWLSLSAASFSISSIFVGGSRGLKYPASLSNLSSQLTTTYRLEKNKTHFLVLTIFVSSYINFLPVIVWWSLKIGYLTTSYSAL